MLSIKIKYKTNHKELITEYIRQYSQMFIYIYYSLDEFADLKFKDSLKEKFPYMDSWFIQTCFIEAKMLFEQNETNFKKNNERIKDIEKDLKSNNITKKQRYKLINKLSQLKRILHKGCTIGGKHIQRKMVRKLNNKDYDKYSELLNIFKEKRLRPIKSIGESPQKGNRKFNFDFENNIIIFKPNSKQKIELKIYDYKNHREILDKLQYFAEQCKTPITISIDSTHVHITYDDEFINNNHFNKKKYFDDLKKVSKDDKEQRKLIYLEHLEEQEQRKLKDKLKDRYIGFDLNPEYIGFTIADKISDDPNGDFKIIKKGYFDLTQHFEKLKLSSSDDKQKKQNNKRKHEIKQVWVEIFKIIEHYKVYNIVLEDLEFKKDKDMATEANRKTKNLWYRTLMNNIITKNINRIGMNKIEVVPSYSSFVGNLLYEDFDPVSASIEITRRGIIKYIKNNKFFPSVDSIKSDKLLFASIENVSTIKELWGKYPELRDRRPKPVWCEGKEINLQSHKSKIKYLIY